MAIACSCFSCYFPCTKLQVISQDLDNDRFIVGLLGWLFSFHSPRSCASMTVEKARRLDSCLTSYVTAQHLFGVMGGGSFDRG